MRHEIIQSLAILEESQRLFLEQFGRKIHDKEEFVLVEDILPFVRGREGLFPGFEAAIVTEVSADDVIPSLGPVENYSVAAITVVQRLSQAAAPSPYRDPLRLLARTRLLLGTGDGRGEGNRGRGYREFPRVGERQEGNVVRIVLDYFRRRQGCQHHQRHQRQGYQPQQARLSQIIK